MNDICMIVRIPKHVECVKTQVEMSSVHHNTTQHSINNWQSVADGNIYIFIHKASASFLSKCTQIEHAPTNIQGLLVQSGVSDME